MDREVDELLNALGYDKPTSCLRGDALKFAPDYGHIFRRAQDLDRKVDSSDGAGLEAVYSIRRDTDSDAQGKTADVVPVTYVCRAHSFEDADKIHRLVWNQTVVPFVVVLTPDGVRLYSGFSWQQQTQKRKGFIAAVRDIDAAARALRISANDINSGTIWRDHAKHIQPRDRVEWRLLENLQALGAQVHDAGVQDPALVHSLIGKFVYFYYLRERDILSDERLGRWGLEWNVMQSNRVTLDQFIELSEQVEHFLNGTIFPLSRDSLHRVGQSTLRRVASVFAGNDAGGQTRLFSDYDFSYIPIETLSVIYEQFLHSKLGRNGKSRARNQGAYYTPIPVVNFIIDRMNELLPLQEGTRVLDPSCGSGAFLVQCYRRLLEQRYQIHGGGKLLATELRQLLVDHIHGIDIDPEACRVAELSLNLTLLDYIDPPDLTNTRFKLPKLLGSNIVNGDAFPGSDASTDVDLALERWEKREKFSWVIGNPPWKAATATNDPDEIESTGALNWVSRDPESRPIGRNQLAEAFAWRSLDFAGENSLVGLLMPASTLFKGDSTRFRQNLFGKHAPAYVANFSNLAEVLFAGRSRVPSSAILFRPRTEAQKQSFPVFSPLVANQELTRPEHGKRIDTWNLVIDEGEVRAVSSAEAATGTALVWKLAAWGCHIDERILRRTSRLPKLNDLLTEFNLPAAQGFELRAFGQTTDSLEHHPELAGESILLPDRLRKMGRLFAFPSSAIGSVPATHVYTRLRGGFSLPQSVCQPPHILISAARNWTIFESRYLIVPPRQIGIGGRKDQADLLKAVTLYLNSDFVQYEQFFASPQLGVQMKRSSLRALRELPIPKPILKGNAKLIRSWASLYDRLAKIDQSADRRGPSPKTANERNQLLQEMNARVGEAIGLSSTERLRVYEFLNVIGGLRDGKVEDRAVRTPSEAEARAYGEILRQELNGFLEGEEGTAVRYDVDVYLGQSQGLVRVAIAGRRSTTTVHGGNDSTSDVIKQSAALRAQLETRYSQWRYFNRSLRLFAADAVYLFKPMQRFHWLQSQAVVDATELISLALEQAETTA